MALTDPKSEKLNMKIFSSFAVDTYSNFTNANPILKKGFPVLATGGTNGDVIVIGDGQNNFTTIKKYVLTEDGDSAKVKFIVTFGDKTGSVSGNTVTFGSSAADLNYLKLMYKVVYGLGTTKVKLHTTSKDYSINTINSVSESNNTMSIILTESVTSLSSVPASFVVEDLETTVKTLFGAIDDLSTAIETVKSELSSKLTKNDLVEGANVTLTKSPTTNQTTISVNIPDAATIEAGEGIDVDTSDSKITISVKKVTLDLEGSGEEEKDLEDILKGLLSRIEALETEIETMKTDVAENYVHVGDTIVANAIGSTDLAPVTQE